MGFVKGDYSNGQLRNALLKNNWVPPDTRLTKRQIAERNRKNIENRKDNGG